MPAPLPLAGATIVFDLDGTLVDTAPDLIGVLGALLAEEGLPPLPLIEARPMIGRGARALITRGFAAAGAPLAESAMARLFDRFIVRYRARIADESLPFPGAVAALDLLHRFAAVVGPDAAPAAKPDPRHLLAAIAATGGDPRRSVMVGDSESDARAARAAGVALVLVTFGYTEIPAADLAPDILIDHFDDLPAACEMLLGNLSAPGPAAIARPPHAGDA